MRGKKRGDGIGNCNQKKELQLPGNYTVPYDNKVQVMTKLAYSSVEKK